MSALLRADPHFTRLPNKGGWGAWCQHVRTLWLMLLTRSQTRHVWHEGTRTKQTRGGARGRAGTAHAAAAHHHTLWLMLLTRSQNHVAAVQAPPPCSIARQHLSSQACLPSFSLKPAPSPHHHSRLCMPPPPSSSPRVLSAPLHASSTQLITTSPECAYLLHRAHHHES